jgi:hypothetical protein
MGNEEIIITSCWPRKSVVQSWSIRVTAIGLSPGLCDADSTGHHDRELSGRLQTGLIKSGLLFGCFLFARQSLLATAISLDFPPGLWISMRSGSDSRSRWAQCYCMNEFDEISLPKRRGKTVNWPQFAAKLPVPAQHCFVDVETGILI